LNQFVTLPLVIVDAANVMGSVPDGWWRDRLGAARRLRAALADLPAAGLPGVPGPVEVVLVVEGAARALAQETGGVPVVAAEGSGDDAIVALVGAQVPERTGRRCIVVTADRGLRERVTAARAEVVGPRAVYRS
jgi:hypothetical protein